MSFTVHRPDGTPFAGHSILDAQLREAADAVGGYITDDATGAIVYPAVNSTNGSDYCIFDGDYDTNAATSNAVHPVLKVSYK